MDARFAGAARGALGLVFGVTDDWEFYQFLVTPDLRYGLWKCNDGAWTELVAWSRDEALRPGAASNRLRVEHNGAEIRLLANGVFLWSAWDFSFTDKLRVSLTAESGSLFPVETRFDNCTVSPPDEIPQRAGRDRVAPHPGGATWPQPDAREAGP